MILGLSRPPTFANKQYAPDSIRGWAPRGEDGSGDSPFMLRAQGGTWSVTGFSLWHSGLGQPGAPSRQLSPMSLWPCMSCLRGLHPAASLTSCEVDTSLWVQSQVSADKGSFSEPVWWPLCAPPLLFFSLRTCASPLCSENYLNGPVTWTFPQPR